MNLQDRTRHLLARRRQQVQNRRANLLGRSEQTVNRQETLNSSLN